MITSNLFNPFTDRLLDTQRLRMIDGKLTVEDKCVRANQMSGWKRFWTRGDYSQTAILKTMSRLFNETKTNSNQLTNGIFLNNYKILRCRAVAQNTLWEKMNCIIRFFAAKTMIDIKPADKKIEEIEKLLVTEADPNNRPWGKSYDPTELTIEKLLVTEADPNNRPWGKSYEPTELTLDYSGHFAYDLDSFVEAYFNGWELIPNSHKGKAWAALFKELGLETLGDCEENGVYDKASLKDYITLNSPDLKSLEGCYLKRV